MTASATPTSTVPFRHIVTSSSLSSSSRRNTGRTITLLLSLAITCCLLASSTSTLVSATPVPKAVHHQRQQRSLLQQVHHVNIVDESVHNSMVLMKKSIQKRKQQQIKQKQQQQQQKQKRSQQQPSVHKKKLQKRQPSEEATSTAFAATVDSRPADDLDSNSRSSPSSEIVKRSSGSKAQEIRKRGERNDGRPSSSAPHSSEALSNKTAKSKKSQGRSKASRAKLISAYEAIVFSESQIPVFWSHDHHGRQQQMVTKTLQKQRPKPANLESKASEAKQSANKGQDSKKSKTPVASDHKDSPLEGKAPVRGNEDAGEGQGQGHGQGVAPNPVSDKNRRATVDFVPVSVTADAQEQLGADEPREHLLPHQAKRAAPARDGSSQHHRRRQYATEGISAFMDHGCKPSSAMMIYGALAALLLVSYKIYKRTQQKRRMAGLTPPLEWPSDKAPLPPSL